MRKKLVPLIAIAFVVAVISTAVFYSLFAGRLNGATETPAVPRKLVVVAARDVPAGTVLSNADLTAIPWAAEVVPSGVYDSVEHVAGKTAFAAILQGEPVLASRLAAKDGTGSGIPEGMRAVSVHVSDSSGVVGMLKPGCKVDVQAFASRSAKGPKDEVRTLLRGVTVLSVSSLPEQSSQGYFSAPVVTVLASAHDAEELAQADSYARLRLALRNPLEKTAPAPAVPVPVGNGPSIRRLPPEARFRVRTVELTDEGLAALAGRVDARIGSPGISVILTGASVSPASIEQLLRPGGMARGDAESLVTAPVRQGSWFDVPEGREGGSGKVRLLLAAQEGGHGIRIRPEVTGVWSGRVETRSLETELDANAGRVIVISGLDRGDGTKERSKFRHLVLLVIPEPAAAPNPAD